MKADIIVLAAGASTRMGHPKALTDIGGETALERIARAAEAAGLAAPIVVLADAYDAVRERVLPKAPHLRLVKNHAPGEGRTGSLHVGLNACSAQRVLVLPVDHPVVTADTLRLLASRTEEWVVPIKDGRGGHPLSLGPMATAAILSAPPHMPLRDVPAAVGLTQTRVPVDDPGIHMNLDTPADVRRALARLVEGEAVTGRHHD